ncbi:MAG TPA: hypothetical protein VGU45_15125 [Microvirga sp.]|nr:hypothetical protein [Microvirga sp.]
MSDLFHPAADELWGRPAHAIHVQPHLTSEVQRALAQVQRQAAALWPGALHLAPEPAIHVTIYPLVRVPGTFDRMAYWSEIEPASRALVAAHAGRNGPITLAFSAVRVMSAGIIAVAEDASSLVEAIRAEIVETLPPPPGLEPLRYDLIHATLARFASGDPVPRQAVRQVEAIPVSIAASVSRLKLTRETLFPCLVTEEIGSYPLAGGEP